MQNKVDKVNQNPDITAEEVFESLHRVMHHFRARHFRALRDDAFDLSHMETKALGFFARNPAATQSDLVGHSGRDKAQIARLIASLRDKDLLAAQPNETDRRSVRLQLTPAGRQIWEAMHQQALQLQRLAVSALSPAECDQLIALLRRIDDRLEPLQ
jgi:DNA-binding MarR family transcriptional regulator